MKTSLAEKTTFWGIYEEQIHEWMEKSEKMSLMRRLWEKDPTLWTRNTAWHEEIRQRLGWLQSPQAMKDYFKDLKIFQEEVRQADYSHAVLLGMGGSSLAPEVMQEIFGNALGYPKLLVLDSTDPARIQDIEAKIDLSKTIFIISSKSGTTIELISLFNYFFDRVQKKNLPNPGSRFIAITDAGTALEKMAKDLGFSRVFLAPSDVGGRFSALTVFGLVPACMIGADLAALSQSAEKMMQACSSETGFNRLMKNQQSAQKASDARHDDDSVVITTPSPEANPPQAERRSNLPVRQAGNADEVFSADCLENPAIMLGLGLAILAESGRDKLTLLSSKKLEFFGDWVEQLVAESTGKEGVGIVPVVREGIEKIECYGPDRFFVALVLESDDNEELLLALSALEKAGHPVLILRLKEASDLGGEFFRWQMATAVACALMKINAFDQPDVQAAKECTKKFLDAIKSNNGVIARQTEISFREFWENAAPGDFAAILAFLPDRENIRRRLMQLRDMIRRKTHLASTLGFGPRYLHSTGQLHKGGANHGVYILMTAPPREDFSVPGESYTFGQLELAQAMGDFEALESKARWLIHVRLTELSEAALDKACTEIENAILAPVQ